MGHGWLRRSFIEFSPEWDEESKKVSERGMALELVHRDCMMMSERGKIVLPCRPAFPPKAKSFFPGRFGAAWEFARAIRSMSMWKDNVLCSPCVMNGLGGRRSSPIP